MTLWQRLNGERKCCQDKKEGQLQGKEMDKIKKMDDGTMAKKVPKKETRNILK